MTVANTNLASTQDKLAIMEQSANEKSDMEQQLRLLQQKYEQYQVEMQAQKEEAKATEAGMNGELAMKTEEVS